MTHPEEALKQIAKIVCTEKQREIDALRRKLALLGEEARGYAARHMYPRNDEEYIDMPHELFDFLSAM